MLEKLVQPEIADKIEIVRVEVLNRSKPLKEFETRGEEESYGDKKSIESSWVGKLYWPKGLGGVKYGIRGHEFLRTYITKKKLIF